LGYYGLRDDFLKKPWRLSYALKRYGEWILQPPKNDIKIGRRKDGVKIRKKIVRRRMTYGAEILKDIFSEIIPAPIHGLRNS